MTADPNPAAADATTAGAAGAAAATAAPEAPAADLAEQLARAQAEAAEFKDAWLRAKAETDNARKIAQADVAKAHKYAIERFAEDLLPVADALEKTLAAGDVTLDTLKAGADLTLKALRTAFDRAQVVAVDPAGEKFDPHRHQAISSVPASEQQPANQVVTVLQKGWTISERVLRPALVVIAK